MIWKLRVRAPARAAGKYSFWPEWSFCADSYSVSVPPRATTVALKRLQSFCQKFTPEYAYTLDPGPNEVGVGWLCCLGLVWDLIRKTSSHATRHGPRLQSSQLAEPLWTDPSLKSGIGIRELLSTLPRKQNQKSAGGEWIDKTFPESSRKRRKSTIIILIKMAHIAAQ